MVEAVAAVSPAAPRTRDPRPLTRTLVFWLWLSLAGSGLVVLNAGVEIYRLSLVDPATPMSFWDEYPGGGVLLDLLTAGAGLVQATTYVVAAFLSLKWIYRTTLNARALAPGLKITPGWAVGWYFVPFANLFKPFQAMREAWQAAARAQGGSDATPSLLRWWWGLWLAHSIVGNFSFRVGMRADTAGDLIGSSSFDVLTEALYLPLTLVFVQVVRRLCDMQSAALQGSAFD